MVISIGADVCGAEAEELWEFRGAEAVVVEVRGPMGLVEGMSAEVEGKVCNCRVVMNDELLFGVGFVGAKSLD